MKIAFKGVLAINFTENKNKLDFDSIKTYLSENSLLQNIDFNDLVPAFDSIINKLIEKNLKDEESQRNLLEEFRFLEDSDISDIIKVWNTEKSDVYTYLMKNHLSSKSLEKVDWSVNMETYSRRSKNLQDLSFLLSLRVIIFFNK